MNKQNDPVRLGVGLYSIPDASRLLKVPVSSVRRWINSSKGVVSCTFDPQERTITFIELMELHFVKLFREAGVSLPTIRKAAKTAAKHFESSHPFAIHRFNTDGRTVFATLTAKAKQPALIEDLKHGQLVFATVVQPFFKKLEYDCNQAARFWPLGTKGRVVLDPKRQFGKPIDSTTGVPTEALCRAVKAGDDPVVVAEWFGVPLGAVRAALAFEQYIAA